MWTDRFKIFNFEDKAMKYKAFWVQRVKIAVMFNAVTYPLQQINVPNSPKADELYDNSGHSLTNCNTAHT